MRLGPSKLFYSVTRCRTTSYGRCSVFSYSTVPKLYGFTDLTLRYWLVAAYVGTPLIPMSVHVQAGLSLFVDMYVSHPSTLDSYSNWELSFFPLRILYF